MFRKGQTADFGIVTGDHFTAKATCAMSGPWVRKKKLVDMEVESGILYASPRMSVFTPEDRFSVVVALRPDKNEFYQRSTVVCRLLAWLTEVVKRVGSE